jgi:hypothetical protein
MIPGRSIEVTADAQVVTGPGRIGAVVLTPAAAVATLILYDNTSAAGTKLITLQAAANGGSVVFLTPFVFSTGVYADIGGSGAVAYVILA